MQSQRPTLILFEFHPSHFVFSARISLLALAVFPPKARRIGRSLVTARAPDRVAFGVTPSAIGVGPLLHRLDIDSVALRSERSGLRCGLDRACGLSLVAVMAAAAWQGLVGQFACGCSLSRIHAEAGSLSLHLARARGLWPLASQRLKF